MKIPFGLPRPPRAPIRPPAPRALYLLFATTVLASVPHLLMQPPWLGAVFVAIIAWRLVIARRGDTPPRALVRAALSVAMVALVIVQYQTIFGRTAGSALLVSFAALKILETSSLRDAMFCNILVTIVVVAAFLFDQSPATAAWGLACVLLVIVNFTLLVSRGSFTAGRALGLTTRIVALGLPIALVAYVLFPRIEGSLWGIAEQTNDAVTGLSDRVEPGSISRLNLDEAVAFRVDFQGDAPPRPERYWRLLVLEQFDGRAWSRSSRNARRVQIKPGEQAVIYRYDLTLEPTDKRWLPVLELPLSIEGSGRINELALARARRPVSERRRYRAASSPATYLSEDVATGAGANRPPHVTDEVLALARSFAADGGGAEAVTSRILSYFREQPFHYTLTPPPTGEAPVHDFLFETRRGYCEHYASAFAALMRAAGFEARVVLGYQGGEFNPSGGYYIVRQYDAHAWAEIRVPGRGWRRIDPTAAVAPERVDMGLEALRRLASAGALGSELDAESIRALLQVDWLDARVRQLVLLGDLLTYQWNTWVMAYGPEQQQLLLRQLGIRAPNWTWMILALTASVSAFVLVTWVLLSGAGRQRASPQKYYTRFLRKLARAGFATRRSEGPRDLARRAAARFPRAQGQIESITGHYAALVYAPAGRARLADLRKEVRQLRL